MVWLGGLEHTSDLSGSQSSVCKMRGLDEMVAEVTPETDLKCERVFGEEEVTLLYV